MGSKMASQATTTPSMLLALQATEAPQPGELSHALAGGPGQWPTMLFFGGQILENVCTRLGFIIMKPTETAL